MRDQETLEVDLLRGHESDPERLESLPTATVASLLHLRQSEVLQYIQSNGMHKLAEFDLEEDRVFSAFKGGPMLTFGSDELDLDAEEEWRKRLNRKLEPNPTGWHSTITVEAFVVPIRSAADPESKGLLHPLLRRLQAKRLSYSVFDLPAVKAIITYKWTMYARTRLMIQLGLFICWLLCFYGFIVAFQGEDLSHSLMELLHTARGCVTVGLEIGVLLCMLPFLAIDMTMASIYRLQWICDPWHILSTLTYINQVAISGMHLGRLSVKSEWLTIVLAVQCIILLFRLQYWSRAFRATRFAFADVLWEVICDTSWLLAFLFLVMGGYAAAFHITFRTADKEPEGYGNIWKSFLTIYEHVHGDIKLEEFYSAKSLPVFGTILAVSYIFVDGFILANLMVGVIISSLDRVMEHADAKQMVARAYLIDEVENTASLLSVARSYMSARRTEYHPRYVHVLSVHEEKLSQVEEDQLSRQLGKRSAKRLQTQHRGGVHLGSGSEGEEGTTRSAANGDAGVAGGGMQVEALLQVQADLKRVLKQQEDLFQLMQARSDERDFHSLDGGSEP
ncbi:TRP11C [Auxenochlorella protothecoides x Auxenochlorella symbiontica]